MIVTETSWGKIVTIPETKNNFELTYKLRNVRKINHDDPDEQPLINHLEKREKRMEKHFMAIMEEMEKAFEVLETGEDFEKWEAEHRVDFNRYFHDRLDTLCMLINGCSFEYAEHSKHGWCL